MRANPMWRDNCKYRLIHPAPFSINKVLLHPVCFFVLVFVWFVVCLSCGSLCLLRPALLIDCCIQCVLLFVYVSVFMIVVTSIMIYLSCYHFWCPFIWFHRSCICLCDRCCYYCLFVFVFGVCGALLFSVRRLRTLVWEVSVDLGCPSVGLCVNLCSRWRCLFQLGRQRLACII